MIDFDKFIVSRKAENIQENKSSTVEVLDFDGDNIFVPMFTPSCKEEEYMHCILTAGADRSIIIFDSNEEKRISRLVALMKTSQRQFDKTLNFFIMDEKHREEMSKRNFSGKIFYCDMSHFSKYYQNDLCGTFPGNETEVVIGISHNENMLSITHEDLFGFAILDNKDVLLGVI